MAIPSYGAIRDMGVEELSEVETALRIFLDKYKQNPIPPGLYVRSPQQQAMLTKVEQARDMLTTIAGRGNQATRPPIFKWLAPTQRQTAERRVTNANVKETASTETSALNTAMAAPTGPRNASTIYAEIKAAIAAKDEAAAERLAAEFLARPDIQEHVKALYAADKRNTQ
jgi:hypothetical protein